MKKVRNWSVLLHNDAVLYRESTCEQLCFAYRQAALCARTSSFAIAFDVTLSLVVGKNCPFPGIARCLFTSTSRYWHISLFQQRSERNEQEDKSNVVEAMLLFAGRKLINS